jgi:transcription termination factor NusB
MEQPLDEWLTEAGFNPDELTTLTIKQKQEKIRDHCQEKVDGLEAKKEKLDQQIQKLVK